MMGISVNYPLKGASYIYKTEGVDVNLSCNFYFSFLKFHKMRGVCVTIFNRGVLCKKGRDLFVNKQRKELVIEIFL